MIYATLKTGISKARDTYGYNRVTLVTEKAKYTECGGGYDMVGSALGALLTAECQKHLAALHVNAAHKYEYVGTKESGICNAIKQEKQGRHYGLYAYYRDGALVKVSLDGGTGESNVIRIAKEAGINVTANYDRSGRRHKLLGYRIEPLEGLDKHALMQSSLGMDKAAKLQEYIEENALDD